MPRPAESDFMARTDGFRTYRVRRRRDAADPVSPADADRTDPSADRTDPSADRTPADALRSPLGPFPSAARPVTGAEAPLGVRSRGLDRRAGDRR